MQDWGLAVATERISSAMEGKEGQGRAWRRRAVFCRIAAFVAVVGFPPRPLLFRPKLTTVPTHVSARNSNLGFMPMEGDGAEVLGDGLAQLGVGEVGLLVTLRGVVSFPSPPPPLPPSPPPPTSLLLSFPLLCSLSSHPHRPRLSWSSRQRRRRRTPERSRWRQ